MAGFFNYHSVPIELGLPQAAQPGLFVIISLLVEEMHLLEGPGTWLKSLY